MNSTPTPGGRAADVSMLVRRVRQRCGNDGLLFVGTSATMVSGGTRHEQREAVARVAGKIFGLPVSPDNAIDERLKRSIPTSGNVTDQALRDCSDAGVPESYADFLENPLGAWIEEAFGIRREGETFQRRTPITLWMGAEQLAEQTGVDQEEGEAIIRLMLNFASVPLTIKRLARELRKAEE